MKIPNPWWLPLLLGLAVREAFSFWTGHPYDLEVWIRTGFVVAHGRNPYLQFWPSVPGASVAYLHQALPSAAYLPSWPAMLGELFRLWETVGGGNRFVLYFLLKQPPIFADLLTAYLVFCLVRRWTGRESAALAALSFWALFPYDILITSVWGQFDSLVVACLLGALWARGAVGRNLAYGLGILTKWLTVIYLPFEALCERGWRRLGIGVALLAALSLTAALFLAEGWTFAGIGATANSQTHGGGGGMNLAPILTWLQSSGPLAGVPYLSLAETWAWIPGVIMAGFLAARWTRPNEPETYLRGLLFVTTVFLLLRWGVYEQYMLYLFVLLALDVACFHVGRRSFLNYLVVVSFAYLLVNNDFLLRFGSPLSPSVTDLTTGLDASPLYGALRTWGLLVLAGLVTVSLLQFARLVFLDRGYERPWVLGFGRPTPPSETGSVLGP